MLGIGLREAAPHRNRHTSVRPQHRQRSPSATNNAHNPRCFPIITDQMHSPKSASPFFLASHLLFKFAKPAHAENDTDILIEICMFASCFSKEQCIR